MEHLFAEKIVVLPFDRKSGKSCQIFKIENDNFYFTVKMLFCNLTENPVKRKFVKLKVTTLISRKKVLGFSFDRKSGNTWQFRKTRENDNFYFTEKILFCYLT